MSDSEIYMYGIVHGMDDAQSLNTRPYIDYLQGHLSDALRISSDATRPIASRIVSTKEAELLRDMIKFIQDRS